MSDITLEKLLLQSFGYVEAIDKPKIYTHRFETNWSPEKIEAWRKKFDPLFDKEDSNEKSR